MKILTIPFFPILRLKNGKIRGKGSAIPHRRRSCFFFAVRNRFLPFRKFTPVNQKNKNIEKEKFQQRVKNLLAPKFSSSFLLDFIICEKFASSPPLKLSPYFPLPSTIPATFQYFIKKTAVSAKPTAVEIHDSLKFQII